MSKPNVLPRPPRPIPEDRLPAAWQVIATLASVPKAAALMERLVYHHRTQYERLATQITMHLTGQRFSAFQEGEEVDGWNMLMLAGGKLMSQSANLSEHVARRLAATLFTQAERAATHVQRGYDPRAIAEGVAAHLGLNGDRGIKDLGAFFVRDARWDVRRAATQQAVACLSVRPLGLHTPLGTVGERIATLAKVYAHPDVLIMPELASLCAQAYLATVLMGLEQDGALTRRVSKCELDFLVVPALQGVCVRWKKLGYRGALAWRVYEILALWERASKPD